MTALYARLLGVVWDRLPVEIRDMHHSAGKAEGRSTVERGSGTLARLVGIVLIDNVLWGGSVANLADKDADTQAIRAQCQAQGRRAGRSRPLRRGRRDDLRAEEVALVG
jgi:hypothetical protein